MDSARSIPARPVEVVLEMLELVAPSDYPSGRDAAKQLAARVRNSFISVLSQPAREPPRASSPLSESQ